ncbi:hypothetical protein Zmor_010364 [Zophobas morio]|uniref:Uncharacterized protein n=1 Tax=Zophobas morio TaxID=2755281 RepID=A0AA38IK62_9CUCU|nr:hypothetical protein Zmor_010364 [Zophobas morio]
MSVTRASVHSSDKFMAVSERGASPRWRSVCRSLQPRAKKAIIKRGWDTASARLSECSLLWMSKYIRRIKRCSEHKGVLIQTRNPIWVICASHSCLLPRFGRRRRYNPIPATLPDAPPADDRFVPHQKITAAELISCDECTINPRRGALSTPDPTE